METLFAAAKDLEREEAQEGIRAAYRDEGDGKNTFNMGILCCIPKGDGEADMELGQVHEVSQTRPLSLVDVSNRMIASAYKKRWEKNLGGWVSKDQRGFLPGRSMMANVLDLETHGMCMAATKRRSLMVLVDFKAAFPSVSHNFMLTCLKGLGVPRSAIRVLEALYLDGACTISSGGALWPGFDMTSGIRQGCPLSPLIFAVCMDLLLRRLQQLLGDDYVQRAFADDVGLILGDAEGQLPTLVKALQQFEAISRMQVNIKKTVGVPLWPETEENAKDLLQKVAPEWRALPIQKSAIYLGCLIGPDKAGKEWEKALAKYQLRARGWQWASLGLHFAAMIYNTYVLSVLSFTAQVARVTKEIKHVEALCLRLVAPGPFAWASPQDLWHLEQHFGMPKSLSSLATLAAAAKLRLVSNDNLQEGGMRLSAMTAKVKEAHLRLEFPLRTAWLEQWRQDAIPTVLEENRTELRARGIRAEDLLQQLRDKARAGKTAEEAEQLARSRLQREARIRIQAQDGYNPLDRIRHKLERWKLDGLPRRTGEKFSMSLKQIGRLVPPRVVAAVFGTAWNRWCTARRFQKRNSQLNMCKLGCGGNAEDSIEHYSRCRVLRSAHDTELGIRTSWLLPFWLGVQDGCLQDVWLARGALGAYSALRVTNAARQAGGWHPDTTRRAFQQAMLEGAAGHKKLAAHLPTFGAAAGSKRRREPLLGEPLPQDDPMTL